RLYELYRTHESLDDIPAGERANLEKSIFRAPIAAIWEQTRDYFRKRDPTRIERAEREPKQKMALVFRWYLGMSSRWANGGGPARGVGYPDWWGPGVDDFIDLERGSVV